MARVPRNKFESTLYHVMTQGINKSYIFNNPEDIKYYIKTMYKLLDKFNIEIIAYCVMSNHLHVLIKTDNINDLSQYMQQLNSYFARYYNKKYNRVGYVFRDRYRAEAIHNENHFYNCIKYIYNNPVKAGICKKPEDYPYSNYKEIPAQITGNYSFIDIDDENEKNCEDFIEEFLNKKGIILQDLKKHTSDLKELVTSLKDTHNLSLRKIAERLDLKREYVRNLYNSRK